MNEIIENTKQKVASTLSILRDNLTKITATGSHPSLLKSVKVNYYETMTPIDQVANISAQDATTLIVTPFDQLIIKDIIEAINKADLGINPVDEGKRIRIGIPPLTSEKRKSFAKDAKSLGESSRISIRNIRQDANKKIKVESQSENEQKQYEENVQKIIDESNKEIEKIIKTKIDDLLKI